MSVKDEKSQQFLTTYDNKTTTDTASEAGPDTGQGFRRPTQGSAVQRTTLVRKAPQQGHAGRDSRGGKGLATGVDPRKPSTNGMET